MFKNPEKTPYVNPDSGYQKAFSDNYLKDKDFEKILINAESLSRNFDLAYK